MNDTEIRSIINSIKTLPTRRLAEIKSELAESENPEEEKLVHRISSEIERRTKAEEVINLKSSGRKEMTEQEELFAKFYHHEKLLVSDMDVTTLREHREQLSKVAFEAKARLVAADDEIRERKAKAGAGKEWLVSTTTSQTTSDAINAVKVRSARMSKMDKLRQQLLSAGIDEETVKEMVANLERKATDKNIKTVTFNKAATEITAVRVETVKADSKPFDPSGLFKS